MPLLPHSECLSFVPQFAADALSNMAALLSVCTIEEQQSVIQFLWSEGVSGAEIHQKFSPQYWDSVLPGRIVYEWIEKFKNGQTTMKDKAKSGCPKMAACDDDIEQAHTMIVTNRQVTISEVAS
jgi:hypothetical protein